jgi:hypothetical protein
MMISTRQQKKYCPETVELLKQIPSVKAAMFAVLPAGSELLQHRDPYAGSLRYHLGLITPNSEACNIIVDGQPYAWRDGEDVLFDETYIHWAQNKTDVDRIILFCDVERPIKRCSAGHGTDFLAGLSWLQPHRRIWETTRPEPSIRYLDISIPFVWWVKSLRRVTTTCITL